MNIRVLCLSILFLYCFQACTSVVGNYKNTGGVYLYTIEINKDHTYFYTASSHLAGERWSFGTWTQKNNILFLKPQPFYDTVRLKNNDTLVLSIDKKHDLIIQRQKEKYFSVLYEIYSKGNMYPQNIKFVPFMNKMIIKRKKLYEFNKNGKIDGKKIYYKVK